MSPNDVVQPDLLVVVPAHGDRLRENGVHGAPDLVIEVISPGTRELDLGKKRSRYAYAGVPGYWVVDPDAQTLTQLTIAGEAYETLGTHTERVQIAILPEVLLDLAEVWPR